MKIRHCPKCNKKRRVKFINMITHRFCGVVQYECLQCNTRFDILVQAEFLPIRSRYEDIRYKFVEVIGW